MTRPARRPTTTERSVATPGSSQVPMRRPRLFARQPILEMSVSMKGSISACRECCNLVRGKKSQPPCLIETRFGRQTLACISGRYNAESVRSNYEYKSTLHLQYLPVVCDFIMWPFLYLQASPPKPCNQSPKVCLHWPS